MGYLVISLKIGQRLQIGDVEVLISDYDMGRVDVAVKAPREIPIRRIPTHAETEFKNAQDHSQKRHRQTR